MPCTQVVMCPGSKGPWVFYQNRPSTEGQASQDSRYFTLEVHS